MRIVAIPLLALALTPLTGCFSLQAKIPPEAVRYHMAHEEGIDIGALCNHGGESFSEGAYVCMVKQRMSCDANGRWVPDGDC